MPATLNMQWSKLTFRRQLSIVLTLAAALITTLCTIFLIHHERDVRQERLLVEGKSIASFLAKEVQLPLYADSHDQVAAKALAMFSYQELANVRVTDTAGQVVVDSYRPGAARNANLLRVTVPVFSENAPLAPEAQLLGDAAPRSTLIGKVELGLDTEPSRQQLQHFIKTAVLTALLFWSVISVFGLMILRQMTGTISRMLDGVDAIAAGNLEKRIDISTSADAERAGAAINKLAETLQQREAENRRLQQELVKNLRLELDEEKHRYMAKLIQTNRLTSLGLLVASMAHEINNPNGTVKLATEYLMKAWRDMEQMLAETAASEGDFSLGGLPFSQARDEVSKALASIDRSSVRIERVVQNLRNYSLGNRGEVRRYIDLNRIGENAIAIVRAYSRQADVNIITRFDPQLPMIGGNPFQLEQVLTNLLLNAIQALPQQGSRRIFLTTEWQRHDNSILVEVRDEGQGIPPEHLPHLCEPFFSTRVDAGGSGLGLYIANYIVSEHKGRLDFESRPGTGCTVSVYLPITAVEETPPAATTPVSDSPPASC